MGVTTVNLIIIVLTVAIMSGIARSLSSQAYGRSAALIAALVVLFLCGEVYRSQLPAPAYSARQGSESTP
jgi:hypothetical protein